MYQRKAKDFELKYHSLCLGNVSGYFSKWVNVYEMFQVIFQSGWMYDFSVHCKAFDISDTTNIHKI